MVSTVVQKRTKWLVWWMFFKFSDAAVCLDVSNYICENIIIITDSNSCKNLIPKLKKKKGKCPYCEGLSSFFYPDEDIRSSKV